LGGGGGGGGGVFWGLWGGGGDLWRKKGAHDHLTREKPRKSGRQLEKEKSVGGGRMITSLPTFRRLNEKLVKRRIRQGGASFRGRILSVGSGDDGINLPVEPQTSTVPPSSEVKGGGGRVDKKRRRHEEGGGRHGDLGLDAEKKKERAQRRREPFVIMYG